LGTFEAGDDDVGEREEEDEEAHRQVAADQ
jgi:hypothetical protein